MIFTHRDLEKIGEAGRFKKRESCKYFVEEFEIMLYTTQDPDRIFM